MRSIKSQRIINMAIKQNNNLTNGVRAGYSDLQTKKHGRLNIICKHILHFREFKHQVYFYIVKTINVKHYFAQQNEWVKKVFYNKWRVKLQLR